MKADKPEVPVVSHGTSSASPIRLAARFLLSAGDTSVPPEPGWRSASRWLALWGATFGLAYVFVYWLTWSIFGEYMQIRLVPCVCLLMVDQLWLGQRMSAGAGTMLHREPDPGDPLGASVHHRMMSVLLILVMLKLALLIYIPTGRPFIFPSVSWRSSLGQWLPEPLYYPLFLMPMWGRWAMMLSLTMGRATPGASRRLALLVEGANLRGVALWGGLLVLMTLVLACPQASDIPRGMVVVMVTIFLAYGLGFTFIRVQRGQSEAGLNATGALAEIAFLMTYLPAARVIYSY